MGRERVFFNGVDRVLMKVLFGVLVVAFTVEATEPSLGGLPGEIGFAVFFAAAAWVAFRVGFRTGVTAGPDGFEVVNFFSIHHIPYKRVASIEQDWLSVRLTLGSGRRIRAWGLTDGLGRGDYVARLGAIVEDRQGAGLPDDEHSRTTFPDWWLFLAVFFVFCSAIAYSTLTS